jgi:hypothetical protein
VSTDLFPLRTAMKKNHAIQILNDTMKVQALRQKVASAYGDNAKSHMAEVPKINTNIK